MLNHDWSGKITSALRQLGADQTLTRGAVLRQKIDQLAQEEGVALQEFLDGAGKKFGELLDDMPDIVVYRRHGTDMYVGLKGAAWPTVEGKAEGRRITTGVRLRGDVYEALTKVSSQPPFFIPSRDEFTRSPRPEDHEERVELPLVTLDRLVEQRTEFAEQHSDEETRDALLSAANHSANPLAEFQMAVAHQRQGRAWHEFKTERLKQELERWAAEHSLAVSPSWFAQPAEEGFIDGPQQLLGRFAMYMTDDEVRSTLVPFRAVEAMFSDQSRRRSP